MDRLSEFKSVQVSKINGLILEKRQDLREEYERLIERANSLQKEMEQSVALEMRANEIVKIVKNSMNVISLLALVSDDLFITDLLSKKISDLTLEEIVGENDISTWLDCRLEIIKKDKDKSNLLKYYQNGTAIKNIKLYDATLKAMYNRRNYSDVYDVAMKYLANNNVVEKFFMMDDLKQDFKNFMELKKVI